MAALKVEVISREMIKPSFPTPHHLKNHQLSFVDQCAPPIYIPLIFFYLNDQPNHPIDPTKRSILLKTSLTHTLSRFYPLAGSVDGDMSIDCNDQGAEYNEANVASDLSKVIENPKMEDLRGLLPLEPLTRNKKVVLGVQVNHFSCGGMAISVCIWHKIADGTALVDFVTAWARATMITNDDDHIVANPKFDLASHFPPSDHLSKIHVPKSSICMEKIVTKRFVFDKKKIDALKEEANSKEIIKAPTRVEVVSAFIWQRIVEAAIGHRVKSGTSHNSQPKMKFVATHAVNLRTRMTQHIPRDAFGNSYWPAISEPMVVGEGFQIEANTSINLELVGKMRKAIREIDDDYIKTLQNGDRCLLALKKIVEKTSQSERCAFSSWCRFPLYEVDFGWGKPIWVCTTTLPFKNVTILLSTRCGDGIEAWVNLGEDDIALLEHDHELLSMAPALVEA